MIQSLAVKNFKSIRELSIDCRRVNVFIGEPNVGKSNLLEALGLFSSADLRDAREFSKLVRFENFINLFCGEDASAAIEVIASGKEARHRFSIKSEATVSYSGAYTLEEGQRQQSLLSFTATANGPETWQRRSGTSPLRCYRFDSRVSFGSQEGAFLNPPDGSNFLFLLRSNPELYKLIDGLFDAKGFRLVLRPHENKVEVQSSQNGRLVQFPYSSTSDTLRRFAFHLAALRTNRDATLIFEEPEAHSFPFYTKQLAEEMALDERGNQFFVTTHNPYFLLPLIYKTPRQELAIFLTAMSNHETKVERLDDARMDKLRDLDADVFFNFDRLLAPEGA